MDESRAMLFSSSLTSLQLLEEAILFAAAAAAAADLIAFTARNDRLRDNLFKLANAMVFFGVFTDAVADELLFCVLLLKVSSTCPSTSGGM